MADKHYNPQIASRLQHLAEGRLWCDLTPYLEGLSHAHFRTAGYLLGESILPSLGREDFWAVVTLLYIYHTKAFLVTCMKAATHRTGEFDCPEAEAFWQRLAGNAIDAEKALLTLLPALPEDVHLAQHMLNVMVGGDAKRRISLLLRTSTPAASFLLFRSMRLMEHDRAFLVRATYYLIKKGDALSFNLASLFKCYFGLEEVRGTFSLRLLPFELDRLENSYDAFRRKVLAAL